MLCTNTDGKYGNAEPIWQNIEKVNALYEQGHEIILWTARGTQTGIDWLGLTAAQLKLWGVKYQHLEMGKPHYDMLIDDKARSAP